MKKGLLIPSIIAIVGLVMISFSVYKIVESKINTHTTLTEAKELIKKRTTTITKEKKEPYHAITGETVGILSFPSLQSELAIVEGTDPDDLEKGVGHYKGSYYPSENGQIVLSGHRDTVFQRLGELKNGDIIKLQMSYGDYEYQIEKTEIVESDDTSIITLQNKTEEVILTTCYPFGYVGNAPQRYIIYANPIIEN